MQVSSSLGNVLNLSVSGASVEDQITFAILALQKFTPKVVYLSADPWLFNKNSGQNRWMSIKDDYYDALRIISSPQIAKANFEKNTKANSSDYAFKLYKNINIKYSKIGSTDEVPGLYDKIRLDGSRIYNMTYANLEPNEMKKGFDKVISYSMTDWRYSHQLYKNFEKLVNYLNNKKIKVFLVLSPYHPALYKKIKNEKNMFLFAEKIFYTLAKEKSIQIIGSYNPNNCGCSENDFFDGMHPKDSCINNIIASSLK
jgi:hypothetical protein